MNLPLRSPSLWLPVLRSSPILHKLVDKDLDKLLIVISFNMLKSALTQKLKQDLDPGALEKEATDRLAPLPTPNLDRFSFPCLANEDTSEDVLQDLRNSVKAENPFLPGSAPTADLLKSGIPLVRSAGNCV